MVIFGTIGLFVRFAPIPSSLLAMLRGYLGSLFLLAWLRLSHRKIDRQAIARNAALLVASGMAIGINWVLLFESYRATTIATATLCYYLQPVFVTLAAPLVLKERIRKRDVLAILVTFLGMLLVSGVGTGWHGGAKGMLLASGAAVFYASVVLMNKRMQAIDPLPQTIIQLAVASTTVVPYVLRTVDFSTVAPTPTAILVVLVVGILHTGVAYLLYFGSMRDLPARTVAILSYLDPVTALLLSALVLKEPMTGLEAVGAVLVLASSLVSQLGTRRPSDGK